MTIFLYFTPRDPAAAEQTHQKSLTTEAPPPQSKKVKQKNLHAQPWAFNKSVSPAVNPWQNGESAKTLQEKAVIKNGKKMLNTAPGIDNALQKANEQPGGLHLSIRNESTSLRDPLPSDTIKPAEIPLRTGRHVLGAFADVRPGDDLSIRLGPELILKDEQSLEKSAGNQPDSAVGMGMQFKLDF